MAAVYEGWEYPPPDCYSCDHRDSEGHLRYKGALLKKGGSRSAKIKTDRNSGDKTPKFLSSGDGTGPTASFI